MAKKVSFVVLGGSGSFIRQFSLSKISIFLFGIIIAAWLGVSGYLLHEHFQLLQARSRLIALQNDSSLQKTKIEGQKEQIQRFATDLNGLKNRLESLNQFEKKIRILANIEIPEEDDNLYGVGGSIPEDLNPQIPLNETHYRLLRQMHEQVELLNDASMLQNQNFESLVKGLQDQQNLLACTPTIRPVETGWISSRFGYRKSPFTGRREFHKGYDISTRKGTPVNAPANGTVTFSGKKGFYGNMLEINHGHGLVTRYAHLSKFIKKRGDKIKRGDTVALVGNTGRSTGPHIHYEVRLNGVPVNPEKYILN